MQLLLLDTIEGAGIEVKLDDVDSTMLPNTTAQNKVVVSIKDLQPLSEMNGKRTCFEFAEGLGSSTVLFKGGLVGLGEREKAQSEMT